MAAVKSRTQKAPGAYRSIGEVSAELNLEPHVLRYWEGRFPQQVAPAKRADGRRLFRPQDIDALRAIRFLVHERGMTLKGAKDILTRQGVAAVLAGSATLASGPAPGPARALQDSLARAIEAGRLAGTPAAHQERLAGALNGLEDVKSRLDALRQRRIA
ncbi:MAG: MerR family transcriptional regulator [Hyphomonas sp.]